MKAIVKHVPKKLVRVNKDQPWMTKPILREINKKKRWHRIAKESGMRKHWDRYLEIQKSVKKNSKKAFWNYMNNILTPKVEENPKIFWRYIKALRHANSSIAVLRKNDELVSDGAGKAEILSEYLKSVFTKEYRTTMPNLGTSPYPAMSDLTITRS